MAGYRMHLTKRNYDFIKDGTKRIELRLLDEKRQAIKVGDRIDFEAPDVPPLATRVIGILYYQNFQEIIKDFPMSILSDEKTTPEDLTKELEEFYTPGLQSTYGVVGFRFELM